MSFPPGTEMFQFPGFASYAYGFSARYPCGWVSPFGDSRIKACSRLPVTFRSVPRPSSPLSAKASTECPSFTSSLSLSMPASPHSFGEHGSGHPWKTATLAHGSLPERPVSSRSAQWRAVKPANPGRTVPASRQGPPDRSSLFTMSMEHATTASRPGGKTF